MINKQITTLLDRFDGGITSQLRSRKQKECSLVANFDIFSDANRLLPHRDLDSDTFKIGESYTAANAKLCRYLAATNAGQTGTLLYGLGVVTGQDYAKIFKRDLPNGAWEVVHPADAQDTVDRDENVFIEYKNVIYGWSRVDGTNARIWSFALTTGTFTTSARTSAALNAADVAHGGVVQGLVHSKDDILYLPYNTVNGSFIVKYNAGTTTWTDVAITLPSNQIITSICEYGNYLAIAVKPRIAGGQSIVYLWDRDASLTTLSEKINWGNEELQIIEEINGSLIGVSTLSAGIYTGSITGYRMLIKQWGGGLTGTTIIREILLTDTIVIKGEQKANNLLYFMAFTQIRDVYYHAIFTFGISSSGVWGLTIDRVISTGTVVTVPTLKGFTVIGDKLYIAYINGIIWTIKRTAASALWDSLDAIYETLVINDGDSSLTKKLIGAEVMFEPLPAAGSVKLEYKINEAIETTVWTEVFDFDTDDAISHGAINIEDTGITLPEYKEIMFRITSNGNAKITSFKYKSEIIGKTLF